MRLASGARLAEALIRAESLMAHATELLPAHGLSVLCLLKLGRRVEAGSAVASYSALPNHSAPASDSLAYAARALGLHVEANRLYRTATTLAPRDPLAWYNLATSERSFGRLESAESACNRSIDLDTNQFPSYLLRAELRDQTPEDNHVDELKALLSRSGLSRRGRMFIAYALAKELDDLRQYGEAFEWFSAGAHARRESLSYDVALDEHKLARIRAVFQRDAPRPPSIAGNSRRFIFIVGLPRSGTTLVERILTGLRGVRSNGETDNFAQALMGSLEPGSADVFNRACAANGARVASAYRKLADAADADDYVVEKLPMNFLYLGAIRRSLPDAQVIWVRRSALDSCFAMYRTLFGRGYPFSYDFAELARYFAAYAALMEHWRSALHGEMLEIAYEELVARPAQIGSMMAEHCGIEWTEAAVHIQENASVSLTASASQIRRPIYGKSSGKWRFYRDRLDPLVRALRARDVPVPLDA